MNKQMTPAETKLVQQGSVRLAALSDKARPTDDEANLTPRALTGIVALWLLGALSGFDARREIGHGTAEVPHPQPESVCAASHGEAAHGGEAAHDDEANRYGYFIITDSDGNVRKRWL